MKISCHIRSSGNLCVVSTRVENAGTNDSAQPVHPDSSRPGPDVAMKSEQEATPMKCPDEIKVIFV
jgi:hypothetical protein